MSIIRNTNITNVSNLIFYLDAVNPRSYPGSGSTWNDLSPNRNNFTLFNTPTYTSNGTTGTYLTFNGTNQYARSNNAINFNAYSAVTIEIGYRTTSTATQVLYETTGTGGSTATGGIALLMNANNTGTVADTYLSTWQGYGLRLFGFTPSTNTTFNSVVETFVNGVDATGRQTYVNASPATYFTNTTVVSTATTTTSGLAFANTWTYIASRAGTGNFFRGDIAYVRAWGKKLATSDISTNSAGTFARQPASYTTPTIISFDVSLVTILYPFTSHTFTTGNTAGRTGPLNATLVSLYTAAGQSWASNATYFTQGAYQGYQKWMVPVTGNYTVRAAGAFCVTTGSFSTFSLTLGRGIIIESTVSLTGGEYLIICVGQRGYPATSGGGGGGTFVVRETGSSPVIVAGGGGGPYSNSDSTTTTDDAVSTTSGLNGTGESNGGTGGNGGSAPANNSPYAGSGGGLLSNGGDAALGAVNNGGRGFNAGLIGGASNNGDTYAAGGFGGGGGTHGNSGGGGGGGGYSGGGGCGHVSPGAGGGGGSYSVSSITTIGYNLSDGFVTITKI